MEREKMKSVDGLVVFAPVIAKILVPQKLWKNEKNSSEGVQTLRAPPLEEFNNISTIQLVLRSTV